MVLCGPPQRKNPDQMCRSTCVFWGSAKRKEGEMWNPHKEIAFHRGTTNLREHLASRHSLDYKHNTTNQTTLLKFSFHCSEARSKQITELTTEMVVVDICPLHIHVHAYGWMWGFVKPKESFWACIQNTECYAHLYSQIPEAWCSTPKHTGS